MSPKTRLLLVLGLIGGCSDDVSESVADESSSTSSDGSATVTVTATTAMTESADSSSTGMTTQTVTTDMTDTDGTSTDTQGTSTDTSTDTQGTSSESSDTSTTTDATTGSTGVTDTDATTGSTGVTDTDATTTDPSATDPTTTDPSVSGGSSSSSGGPECFDDLGCDDALPCTLDECDAGSCTWTPLDGVQAPAELQTDGDCGVVMCTMGMPTDDIDDADLPDDDNACTDDVCEMGVGSNPPNGAGGQCPTGVCDGNGACVECNAPSDCTSLPPNDDCQTRTCDGNVCGQSFTAPNTAVSDAGQTDGDCQVVVCDGMGGSGPIDDDADPLVDGLECTTDACDAGNPVNDPSPAGTTCAAGVCDGTGGCVGCVEPDDCNGTPTFCQAITCDAFVCGVDNTSAGTDLPAADQNVACQTLECDGSGGVVGDPHALGSDCTDALFCNGADTCDAAGACTHTGSPCGALEACNETADACRPNVWINELHYDNSGADVNEFVEVAVVAGVDINTVTVTLYNGSNGASYNTMALTTFVVGTTVNGVTFYSRVLPVNGLQNDNEGIALDVSGTVIEFIGYEGGVLATAGVANGLMSVDIGVSEQPAPAAGSSLGRIGSGRQGDAFTWAVIADDNPGDVNSGQTISP
ncbi:MAG TPA: hypothetical protein VG755_42385 [Nannocystaceae bacterium]|nr:hypothetical protein [Nannocystaceae bacterium]